MSRSPYGERGLKSHWFWNEGNAMSRSPYGERGLKYQCLEHVLGNRVALLTESVD